MTASLSLNYHELSCQKMLSELEYLRNEPFELVNPEALSCLEISDIKNLCDRPLVSVVMITYNHEKYIREAIEGVVNQETDFQFELIIGEDCSTDNTRKICLDYKNKYPKIIRVIYSINNVGASANSLRTLAKCRGQYVAICEGDDYWCDMTKLQRQVSVFEKYPHVGLVYCEGRTVTESGQLIKERSSCRKEGIEPREARFQEMFHRVGILTCSVILRNEILQNAYKKNPLFYVKLYVGDILHWMSILETHDFYFIDQIMVTYHKHSTSAMRTFPFEVGRDVNLILYFYAKVRHNHILARLCMNSLLYCRLQSIENISNIGVRLRSGWNLFKVSVLPSNFQSFKFYLALALSCIGLHARIQKIRYGRYNQ